MDLTQSSSLFPQIRVRLCPTHLGRPVIRVILSFLSGVLPIPYKVPIWLFLRQHCRHPLVPGCEQDEKPSGWSDNDRHFVNTMDFCIERIERLCLFLSFALHGLLHRQGSQQRISGVSSPDAPSSTSQLLLCPRRSGSKVNGPECMISMTFPSICQNSVAFH